MHFCVRAKNVGGEEEDRVSGLEIVIVASSRFSLRFFPLNDSLNPAQKLSDLEVASRQE